MTDDSKKYIEAEKDYMSGMKYKDIASKYNVSLNTVKSWKQRYEWNKGMHTKKEYAHKKSKPIDDGTKETLKNEKLNSEQQMFCIYYSRSFNAVQSYLKAYGCTYKSAMVRGCNLLSNVNVKEEIDRLKEIKRQQIVADPEDIVEMQMRIAFGDISDFVSFGTEEVPVMSMYGPVQVKDEKTGKKKTLMQTVNTIKFKDSENTDMQLIQEVKQGKDGASIKLADRQKAIDWLTKYFLMHPADKLKADFDKIKLEHENESTTERVVIRNDIPRD